MGAPILVTVEDEGDVAAFANFVPDASGGDAAPVEETAAAAPAPTPAAAPAVNLPYHIVVGMPALSPSELLFV